MWTTNCPSCNGYHAVVAQEMYERRRAVHRKMLVHPQLKAAVEDRLKAGWSPQQIAGRMRLERHPLCISHETIYRFAYSKVGRAEGFYRHLPEHRVRRRARGYRKYRHAHITEGQSLSQRPDRISDRSEFGHWECDLVMFRKEHGRVNVTSLVERVSRYAVVIRNEDRQSKPIMEALINGLAPLPAEARQSITFDRGTEFSAWQRLKDGIGADSWFCDPQAPLAERYCREYQQQAAKVPAPFHRTDGADKSISEVDLPAPQFHAAQMSRLPDPG